MCGKNIADHLDAVLTRKSLTRRQFAAMSTIATIAACSPTDDAAATDGLIEDLASIKTPDGTADAFFVRPAEGKHPGIIMWPDVAGLRDAYKMMARRLASTGYAVLVPNQYYRNAKAPVLTSLSQWFEPASQAKLKPMMAQIDGPATVRDASAFAAWLDEQSSVDIERRLGTAGYCMGGAFALRTAAAAPDRIGAACSFHGAQLVTEQPDSPHLLIKNSQARFLIAIGKDDDAQHPDEKDILHKAAEAAGRPAEIEVYPTNHGWCTIDAPSYDKEAAEKAWNRMLATFETAL